MQDCLTTPIPPETIYNCTNLFAHSCINSAGFEPRTLWTLTQKIQSYCPTDPRLFISLDPKSNLLIPATPNNAALTHAACKVFARESWTMYATSDIWARLQTWKFPLFQLIVSSPRPPLGWRVEGFVLVHLLGDPVGTVGDLVAWLRGVEGRARECEGVVRGGGVEEEGRLWKALGIIVSSYDEWGVEMGDEALRSLGSMLNEIRDYPENKKKKFLEKCYKASIALVADRSTAFLPILTAQVFFVGGLAVAVGKAASLTSSSSLFINVEAHSIAFSALFFWIIPAVFLSSAIGVSQTEGSIPRILKELRDDLVEEWARLHTDEGIGIDTKADSQMSASVSLSADVGELSFQHHVEDFQLPAVTNRQRLADGKQRPMSQTTELPSPGTLQERIVSGGIYSWQPLSKHSHKYETLLKCLFHLLKDPKNWLPLFTVSSGSMTAMLISGFVPADGWQTRHCAYAAYLSVWLLSFFLTEWLKRRASSPHPNPIISYLSNRKVQQENTCLEAQTAPGSDPNLDIKTTVFYLTFVKDTIIALGTIGALLYVQAGSFNNCESYTLWGRYGLANPLQPDTAAILSYRIKTVYPAIAFVSISMQIVLLPIVVVGCYWRALETLCQTDDRGKLPWQMEWLGRLRGRVGRLLMRGRVKGVVMEGVPLVSVDGARDSGEGRREVRDDREGLCGGDGQDSFSLESSVKKGDDIISIDRVGNG